VQDFDQSTGTDLTNDLLRFAVAETLSIGRAASDGVSLCLRVSATAKRRRSLVRSVPVDTEMWLENS
jgi:negative regulator of replication initiation